jgi:hypothetical protein
MIFSSADRPGNRARVVAVCSVFFAAFASSIGIASAAPPLLFTPPVTYPAGGSTTAAAVADVNGDGKPDLIVAIGNDPGGTHASNGLVGVLLGNGDGTFQTPVVYDSGGNDPTSLAVADLNGDGVPDIAVANFCVWIGNSCSDTTVGILLGRGDGTFAPVVKVSPGGNSATSIAIADVNGDGKPDIVVPVNVGSVGLLLGKGDGTFQTPTLAQADGISSSIAVADINNDGRPDLVLAGYVLGGSPGGLSLGVVRVLRGNGDGTFQPEVVFPSGASAGGWAKSVAIADLNGDGQLDLAVADYPDNATGVLLGNGDTNFDPVVLYGSGAAFSSFEAIADVNGDGRPDLIVADFAGTVGVLLGNGDGTFQAAQAYNVTGDATSVVAADVNGDSRPDLIVTNGTTSVSVLLNDSGCSGTPPAITLSADPTSLWPPNGRMVPVTVSGTIADSGCEETATATYAVHDEYGIVHPAGSVVPRADGSFSFTALLQASRQGGDRDGRQYTITVHAENGAGASQKAIVVTVPHDRP